VAFVLSVLAPNFFFFKSTSLLYFYISHCTETLPEVITTMLSVTTVQGEATLND